MTWTDERFETAKRLWLEGRSAAEISMVLNVTRNVVIGKLSRAGVDSRHRASLPLRARPPEAPKSVCSAKVPPKNRPAPAKPKQESPKPAPTSPGAWLVDLRPRQCRWPISDPGPGRMDTARFCAHPTKTGPYCAHHAKVARAGA